MQSRNLIWQRANLTDLKKVIRILTERVDVELPPPPLIPSLEDCIIDMDSLFLYFYTLIPDPNETDTKEVRGDLKPQKRRGDETEKIE